VIILSQYLRIDGRMRETKNCLFELRALSIFQIQKLECMIVYVGNKRFIP
jgi:hypothetical protein